MHKLRSFLSMLNWLFGLCFAFAKKILKTVKVLEIVVTEDSSFAFATKQMWIFFNERGEFQVKLMKQPFFTIYLFQIKAKIIFHTCVLIDLFLNRLSLKKKET